MADEIIIEANLEENEEMAHPEHMESGSMELIASISAQQFASDTQRRTQRADQLAGDAAAMWAVALTTPTTSSAMAQRIATEAGSGRTRIESNSPAGSQTIGGAG